ncbi:histidine kinase [Algibacter miyuki]|uniref:Histidine kinase n=1 Tax=Algibacter miyuki TaxID=1306933 RepID=A0ABV5H2P8_9FLAO|nr:sensor histidine kinase [Algibacter miyuki]MDN3664425.1 sensor histidine kinase [Algibacter miyuki]
MRFIRFAFIFFASMTLCAQDLEVNQSVKELSAKIQTSENTERLKWMDSLVSIVKYKSELKYDSIVKQTIRFGIELDSLEFAGNHIADFIYYLNNIARNPEAGLALYNLHIDTFEHLGKSSALTRFYLNVADSYYYLNDLERATEFYNKSIAYAKYSEEERLLAFSYLYLGYTQSDTGKFARASKNIKSAITIFSEEKDTFNILSSKNALSILYSKNSFFKEAETERNEAIELARLSNNTDNLIGLYFNAAQDCKKTSELLKEIEYLELALIANSKTDNVLILKPIILSELVIAYSESNNEELAETHFGELKTMYLDDKSESNRESFVYASSVLEFNKKNYATALAYGKEYLNIRTKKNSYEEIMLAEKFISKVYAAINDPYQSNEHLVNYYKIKDSITNAQNIKSLTYYQTLYETEKRDRQIETQSTSIELLNAENRNMAQLFIFGSLGLLAMFGGILFYRSFINAKKREIVQKEFSQELIKTQEKERTRISKDLHDSVGQQLVLLKWKTQTLNQPDLSQLVQNTLEEVRHISRDLYPVTLTTLGLTNSIEQLLSELDETTELFVNLSIDNVNNDFDEVETLNFYRFIQESLSNVLKHANASSLFVNILKQKNGVKVLIRDNGNGFEVSESVKLNSLGLKTMTERINILKGSLAIKSKKNKGTLILVQIPGH